MRDTVKHTHTAKESVRKEDIYTVCIENAAFSLHRSTQVFVSVPKKESLDSFAFHIHRRKELLFLESGTATLHLEGREFNLVPGEMYLLPELTVHWLEITSDNTNFACLNFIFEKLQHHPYTKDLYSDFCKVFDEIGIFKTALNEKMISLMQAIANAESDLMLLPVFSEFMLRFLSLVNHDISQIPNAIENDLDEHVRDIYFSNGLDRFFNHCYMNDTSLAELSDALHLSTRQTERCINKLYGMPMRKRIIYMRLVNAAYAVLKTDLPTSAIADYVGFNNYNAFLDAFRKQYGCTPSEYRKKYHSPDTDGAETDL